MDTRNAIIVVGPVAKLPYSASCVDMRIFQDSMVEEA